MTTPRRDVALSSHHRAFSIAALYVDSKRGPYPALGIECWDEERDATTYNGPHPVVAHPPCAAWGRYAHKALDDGSTGPVAVEQVRKWGGVLEHPKDSKLWAACGLPRPGELPDEFGGWTMLVHQRDWGHRADKPTWLYIVGVSPGDVPALPKPQPPREAWVDAKRRLVDELASPGRKRGTRGIVERMSKNQRHLTPPAFAQWLVVLALNAVAVDPATEL